MERQAGAVPSCVSTARPAGKTPTTEY